MDAESWIKEAAPRLKKMLTASRYRHTLSVTKLTLDLARAHGLHELRSAQAGLLHDCAKGLSMRSLKGRLAEAKTDVFERQIPALWHASVGVLVAREEFGIRNKEVLTAIRWHSSGRVGMSAIQQALFVADYAEYDRNFSGLKKIRNLARKDLTAATLETLKQKTLYLLQCGQAIHPAAVHAWNHHLIK